MIWQMIDGYVALKGAAEDREGWRHMMSKPALH